MSDISFQLRQGSKVQKGQHRIAVRIYDRKKRNATLTPVARKKEDFVLPR